VKAGDCKVGRALLDMSTTLTLFAFFSQPCPTEVISLPSRDRWVIGVPVEELTSKFVRSPWMFKQPQWATWSLTSHLRLAREQGEVALQYWGPTGVGDTEGETCEYEMDGEVER
jgi:hypothetical protein